MCTENYTIEEYGKNGFQSYRIPGIVVTKTGTILVYYETRMEASNDWSTRGVGMRRSTDGGKTFSPRRMLAYSEDQAINNPLMISSKDGRVHFFWQKDYRQAFYQVSEDDGVTFSPPISLTPTMELFRDQYDWTLYAFGPGHGIELENGRLLVPVWLANGKPNDHFPTQVSVLVSDDGGNGWQPGEIVRGSENIADPFAWPNETQAVELSDGSVLLNIRHNGSNHVRYTAVSPNGKDHFSPPQPDNALPDSICFGSIVRANNSEAILFVNCANRDNPNPKGSAPRRKLTVRLSEDNGRTWKYSRQLAEIGGYADIAAAPDGSAYYCFFEEGNPPHNKDPKQLTFSIFNREWLTNNSGKDDTP